MRHNQDFKVSKKQCIETGMLMTMVALISGIIMEKQVFQFIAVGFTLAMLLFPVILYPFAYVWFGFSRILGMITSRILLYLIFFLIVTPVAFIRRASGKDRLSLKDFKKRKETAFVIRSHKYIPEDLVRPF